MLSQSRSLRILALIIATAMVSAGINGILRPKIALSIFGFDAPASPTDQKLVDSLMAIYGVRDLYMGLSVYVAMYFGNRKTLAWTLFALTTVAFVDGAVTRSQIGTGEWVHWAAVPVGVGLGTSLLGVFD